MTEAEARQVVLLRAFEDPLTAPWTEADREGASREAARELGETAPAERLIARRAAWSVTRLARRLPAAASALAATTAPAWLLPAVLLIAFAIGLAIDAIGNARHINILPPHLLAMLLWNVAVYGLLAVHALWSGSTAWLPLAWLRSLASRVAGMTRSPPPALARFLADWLHASQVLQATRLAATLHVAAAVLAVGAIVSMYARGSFFALLAGWESTFFDAGTMHALVTGLLGPASRISGIALPDEAGFAALNFAHGGGEIAARWIHLFAVTIVAVIVLPRLVLAAWSAWRARTMRRDFALPLNEPYFQHLLPRSRDAAAVVSVLPFSYRVASESAVALRVVLAPESASELHIRLHASVALGGEDEPEGWYPALSGDAASLWVALFALTATPERETHGAFLQALAAHLPAGVRLLVLIDEAGFRERFDASRLAQRRDAWRGLMQALGHEPRFVDLMAPVAAPESPR